jgi:hypothetical protein
VEEENIFVTDEWKLYEKGKSYNTQQGLYKDTEDNYDFYHGNQWKGARLGSIQPITLNVIRPTVKYKVGVLNNKLYQVVFNPSVYSSYKEGERLEDICKGLNNYTNKIWEAEQVNSKVREVLKDACINGEGIVHSYEENGKIKVETIDKTNIYYGNENDSDIQSQPYILISYRRPVEAVKEMARKNGMSDVEIDKITSDADIEEQSGRDRHVDEVTPMCLVLRKYFKKDGTVWVKESTHQAIVREEVDTKLEVYPIAHFVWEEVKGYARGNGEVKYLIPNQIEINKTATRISLAVQLSAYPKLVANKEYIANPKALDKVGSTILLDKMQASDVNKIISYLKPAGLSPDALNLLTTLVKNTQDLAGAGDNVNGNIDPSKASGRAILAVQENGQRPLNEQSERFKHFLEDLARVWFAMLKDYTTEDLTVTVEEIDVTGKKQEIPVEIKVEDLKAIEFNICIDITNKSAFDKYAQEQSLENLLVGNFITFEEYVKALDVDSDMPKSKLEKIINDRQEANERFTQMEMQANALKSGLDQVMAMQEGGNPYEMSQMQANRNGGSGAERQQSNVPM